MAPPATLGPCSACVFWDAPNLEAGLGWCRVNPPVQLTSTASGQTAAWPLTRSDDWCGDWTAAAAAAAATK